VADDDWIDDLIDEKHKLEKEVSCQYEEIQRLRAALALAVGELSTHGQYAVYSPDQLMQQFLEEARRD
jgi:hypothetical protein